MQKDLELIEFRHPLYPKDYDDEYYGTDEFYENNKQLYLENKHDFYKNLIDHFYSDHKSINLMVKFNYFFCPTPINMYGNLIHVYH